MIYIGVDPGVNGGIAAIQEDDAFCKVIYTVPMPKVGNVVDFAAAADFLDFHNCIAYVEKVHSMPKQGVSTMFKFGFVTGGIYGVLATLKIPVMEVTPSQWKRFVLKGLDNKDKDSSAIFCRRMFPDVSLLATERSLKAHSGMADALCIAYYALKKH